MDKIRPLKNRILIMRELPAEKAGRIIIPEKYRKQAQGIPGLPDRESVIMALGPDVHPSLGLEVGQRVIVGSMRGEEVRSRSFRNDDDRLQLVDTDDVFGVIEDEK